MGTLWKLLNIWSPQRIFLGDVPCAQLQHWIHVPCHPRKLPRCWRPDKKGHPERSVFRRSLQNKKKREDSAGFSWQLVSIGFSSSFKKSPNLPGHRMTLSTLGCVVTHQCHTCGKGFWLLQGTQRGFWKRWWNIPGEPNKKPSPVDAHSWVYHYLGSSKLTPNWLVNGILLLGLPH